MLNSSKLKLVLKNPQTRIKLARLIVRPRAHRVFAHWPLATQTIQRLGYDWLLLSLVQANLLLYSDTTSAEHNRLLFIAFLSLLLVGQIVQVCPDNLALNALCKLKRRNSDQPLAGDDNPKRDDEEQEGVLLSTKAKQQIA